MDSNNTTAHADAKKRTQATHYTPPTLETVAQLKVNQRWGTEIQQCQRIMLSGGWLVCLQQVVVVDDRSSDRHRQSRRFGAHRANDSTGVQRPITSVFSRLGSKHPVTR